MKTFKETNPEGHQYNVGIVSAEDLRPGLMSVELWGHHFEQQVVSARTQARTISNVVVKGDIVEITAICQDPKRGGITDETVLEYRKGDEFYVRINSAHPASAKILGL